MRCLCGGFWLCLSILLHFNRFLNSQRETEIYKTWNKKYILHWTFYAAKNVTMYHVSFQKSMKLVWVQYIIPCWKCFVYNENDLRWIESTTKYIEFISLFPSNVRSFAHSSAFSCFVSSHALWAHVQSLLLFLLFFFSSPHSCCCCCWTCCTCTYSYYLFWLVLISFTRVFRWIVKFSSV